MVVLLLDTTMLTWMVLVVPGRIIVGGKFVEKENVEREAVEQGRFVGIVVLNGVVVVSLSQVVSAHPVGETQSGPLFKEQDSGFGAARADPAVASRRMRKPTAIIARMLRRLGCGGSREKVCRTAQLEVNKPRTVTMNRSRLLLEDDRMEVERRREEDIWSSPK